MVGLKQICRRSVSAVPWLPPGNFLFLHIYRNIKFLKLTLYFLPFIILTQQIKIAILKIMKALQPALATEVRRLRRKLHIDQETLAERVGVTRSSISNIESSRQGVSLEMFFKLASALNQDPVRLLEAVRDSASSPVTKDDIKNPQILEIIQSTLNK